MIIYSIGYNAWSFYEFKSKVEDLGNPLIVDVRFSAKSFNPFWVKSHLEKVFGKQYIHIKNLGNINYSNDKPIKISNLSKGCEELVDIMNKQGCNCLLLCACEDVEKCHRKIVADHLVSIADFEIVHLKEEE